VYPAAGQPDPRTVHCANPVSSAWRKFGMNIWVSDSSLQELTFLPPQTPLKKGIEYPDDSKLVLSRAEELFQQHCEEDKRRKHGRSNKSNKGVKKHAIKKTKVLSVGSSSEAVRKKFTKDKAKMVVKKVNQMKEKK
jgi:hypothetical protein